MTLTFQEAEVPVGGSGVGNPFSEVVKSLVGIPNRAKAFTLPGKAEPAENEALRKALGQLARAGDEHGVTVRKKYAKEGDGVKVTFWTTERQKKNRKATETAPETASEGTPAPAPETAPAPAAPAFTSETSDGKTTAAKPGAKVTATGK